jgi:NAD(P)-dependent dehydrogenase (short-subunit alcohol dehydrogenase family)
MDVRKPESVSQAVSQVLEKHGRIDMLVVSIFYKLYMTIIMMNDA